MTWHIFVTFCVRSHPSSSLLKPSCYIWFLKFSREAHTHNHRKSFEELKILLSDQRWEKLATQEPGFWSLPGEIREIRKNRKIHPENFSNYVRDGGGRLWSEYDCGVLRIFHCNTTDSIQFDRSAEFRLDKSRDFFK